MKNVNKLTTIIAILGIASLVAGCETISENNAEIATSQKEMLMTDAGFRARTVTTPKQQQQVAELPPSKVSAVKYDGKLYYVYPTTKKDQILVGSQPQFDAYKDGLQSTRSSQGNNPKAGDPVWVEETAGPNNVTVETFEALSPENPGPGY